MLEKCEAIADFQVRSYGACPEQWPWGCTQEMTGCGGEREARVRGDPKPGPNPELSMWRMPLGKCGQLQGPPWFSLVRGGGELTPSRRPIRPEAPQPLSIVDLRGGARRTRAGITR